MVLSITLVRWGLTSDSLAVTNLRSMLCFAALGKGDSALFQRVPLRWSSSSAVDDSMNGEVSAFGGGLVPNAMALSKQHAGT